MWYKIALFLHVSGALLLCAAMAIEWLCVIHLKNSGTLERIREIIHNYTALGKLGGIAMILILIPGIYMMATAWKDAGWIMISFAGLILIGLIGGLVTGRKRSKIKKILANENTITPELRAGLEDGSLRLSIQLRTFLFLGIIFLMTVKPGLMGSIIVIVLSAIPGFIPLKKRTQVPVMETE